MNNFIKFILLLLITQICLSCGEPDPSRVFVSVIDKDNEQPLDSARVILYRIHPELTEVLVDSQITDQQGTCDFSFQWKEGYKYQVVADRKHYQESLNEDGATFEHQQMLEEKDTNEVHLLLEQILPPDPDRFEKMHAEVSVSQVIAAITADEWEWAFLPKMGWEDIPALIQMAGDTNHIINYPRHPMSRYRPDSVRAGLVALWLVEAIRKQAIRNTEARGNLMPPSRAPVLGTRRGNPKGYNSIRQMESAKAGYEAWWEEAQQPEQTKAIRKNPLRGKGLSWM